jgi:hypothetical protein
MPPRRGYLKPPARIIRRGSRILRPLVTGAVSPITKVGTDGTTAATVQDTTPTTAWPSGITDGDLVVLEVTYGSGGTPTTISQASGATMTLASDLSDTSIRTATYTRFFVTGDTAPTFTLSTARSWATHATAFRGVDTVHRFGPNDNDFQQTAQASSTTYTSGSLTPDEDLAMAVLVWGGKIAAGGTQTITVASGWADTGAINQCNIAATTNVWCDIQYQALGTAAATSESVTIGTAAVGQGTILALQPTAGGTSATAENAVGTGSSLDAQIAIAPNAENAAGTGAAQDPTPGVSANAENAAGTGAAFDATVSTISGPNAPAEVASGTGAAQDPTVTVAPNAENASGVGTAQDATGGIGAQADAASGTGTAQDPLAAIAANAENASGTGQALDPTVVVGVFVPAENAAGTAAALDATVIVAPAAQNAAGTGTAGDATVLTGTLAQAESADGAGSALDPTIKITPNAENAAGTSAANNATVAFGKDAPADIAAGTGAALDPTVRISPAAENAGGTGQALDAMIVFELIVIYATGAATLQSAATGTVTAATASGAAALQLAATGEARTQ